MCMYVCMYQTSPGLRASKVPYLRLAIEYTFVPTLDIPPPPPAICMYQYQHPQNKKICIKNGLPRSLVCREQPAAHAYMRPLAVCEAAKGKNEVWGSEVRKDAGWLAESRRGRRLCTGPHALPPGHEDEKESKKRKEKRARGVGGWG